MTWFDMMLPRVLDLIGHVKGKNVRASKILRYVETLDAQHPDVETLHLLIGAGPHNQPPAVALGCVLRTFAQQPHEGRQLNSRSTPSSAGGGLFWYVEETTAKPRLDLRPKGDNGPAPQPHEPPTKAARLLVVENAVRWSMNILVDVLGNHALALSLTQREAIKRAIAALADFRE